MNKHELKDFLDSEKADKLLAKLYPDNEIDRQKKRYYDSVKAFAGLYPSREELNIYSAPGRTEICGNHTDHQRGRVLAASVNLDAIAVVSFHEDGVVRIKSEGYAPLCINLDDLELHDSEKGTTTALVKGIISSFEKDSIYVKGFDAYITSNVLVGSGLSSSAAFEVLIGTVIDEHYGGSQMGAVKIARIGQLAENEFFGKKSGLMDQTVSAVGGFVRIDFADADRPAIKKVDIDFNSFGIIPVITDTKGSHAGLSDDYTAIPNEMRSVAGCFKKEVLSEVGKDEFWNSIGMLRGLCSDRAILRAAHYFEEDERVEEEAEALENGDIRRFLNLVNRSGLSSALYLQNLYTVSNPSAQGIPLALMISERVLRGRGACRVHGGGFAGTIQAFVPSELLEAYTKAMEITFGGKCCHVLSIRNTGGCCVI